MAAETALAIAELRLEDVAWLADIPNPNPTQAPPRTPHHNQRAHAHLHNTSVFVIVKLSSARR